MMKNQRIALPLPTKTHRGGFTLIELLIVVSIIAILLTMTVMAVNFSQDAERVRGGASSIQSFLAGARDRAIYEKEPRGVRFFLDPTNPRAVTAMVYIDPAEYWSDGTIRLERFDGDGDEEADGPAVNVLAGVGTAWWELKRRGLLVDGLRVRIPAGPRGSWYPVNTSLIDVTTAPETVQRLVLGIPYRDPGDTNEEEVEAFNGGGPSDYELELPARILPMEPVLLPNDTVIDLDGSRLPPAWRPSVTGGAQGSGNLQYNRYMDVVFSPRGTVIGSAASGGVIHMYVADANDAVTLREEFTRNSSQISSDPNFNGNLRFTPNGVDLPAGRVAGFNSGIRVTPFIPADEIDPANGSTDWADDLADPGEPYLIKDRRIVSIFAQTGAVTVSKVDPTDADGDGRADDPFFFAETGRGGN